MSFKVLQHILEKSKSKGSARVLMLVIASMANDEGMAFPGKARLGRYCNVSPRTVANLIRECELIGELRVEYHKNPETGAQTSSRYWIQGVPDIPTVSRKVRSVRAATESELRRKMNRAFNPMQPSSPPHATVHTPPMQPYTPESLLNSQLNKLPVTSADATDRDYANFLKDLHAPKPMVKRPAGAMPNPNHGDLLTANQPVEPIAPPEFDMLVTAVTATLKQYGGGAEVFAKMLMGMKGRGEFNTYRMDIPVTATELQDWALWYKRDNPGLNVPTTPMKLTSSILAYRDQLENRTAVRNSALELAPESPTTTAADRAAIREAIAARRAGGNS